MKSVSYKVWDQAGYQVRDQIQDQISILDWYEVWSLASVYDTVRLQVTDRILGHIRRQVKDQR